MRTQTTLLAVLLGAAMTLATGAPATKPASPPVAAQKPHVVPSPFGARQDPWYWLRDDQRKDPQMLAYLEAENAWHAKVMAPLAPLQQKLYDEIVGRLKQDDASVPVRHRGYWYYTRYETGRQYPIHARRTGCASPTSLRWRSGRPISSRARSGRCGRRGCVRGPRWR